MLSSEGLILGLSTGVVCLAYCGPVLIPYILAESTRVKRNYLSLVLFLGGRLIAYLATGLIAGLIGMTFFQKSAIFTRALAIVYMLLALLMIIYGFHRFREICLGSAGKNVKIHFGPDLTAWVPFLGGVLTGFNLCPPFMMAFTKAFATGNISGSLMLFFWFFLGTSVYFIPLPLIGFVRRQKVLQIIGKFASILAGFYYFYLGLIMLVHK